MIASNQYEEIVADVEETNEDIRDESFFYVERATGLIYEVKLFTDYAVLRPATPEASGYIFRLSLSDFSREFKEYLGDSQVIRNYLWGEGAPDSMVIDRKK